MLLSMTGHGEANRRQDGLSVAVEVRTINSRYFKLSVRSGEGYLALESQIEAVVRRWIRRGAVQVNLRVEREPSPDDYRLNTVVLASYRSQLERLYDSLHINETIHPESLLSLPGVVDEQVSQRVDPEKEWPLIEAALSDSLEHLGRMRREEGDAMAADLRSNCESIRRQLGAVEERAPQVVEAYRGRLTDRLNRLLSEHGVRVEPADIVREVGVFAERSDIAEEVVRLRSHLDQFDSLMRSDDSNGRKLDFLTQEMFRETNTIGSKANDAAIQGHVVEMKASIERMREMIQNVE